MWNIKQLKLHLETNSEISEKNADYLDSLSRCIEIFDYHKEEAYSVIEKFDSSDLKFGLKFVLSTGDQRAEHEYSTLVAQAHIHAALQSSRAMYDIFAQLLNSLLAKEPIEIHRCDISKVFKLLPDGALKSQLEATLNGYDYSYVSGFVNTIKHRNLVQCGRQLDFIENRASIRIKSFSYCGDTYDPKWAVDVLQYGLNIRNNIVELGRLLSLECGANNV
ncbi:TPA: hypothetical protein ACVU5U_001153 [Vibrio parahaemolyticus]|uniref:hypothetical protein n=1 Tax=Vibrio TaxID=662 RepID=UPI001120D8AE|nr:MULTISPECIES: hypothetical protein [Vibrio]EGQ9232893.1 hypothetical protein [Vibrio alginolyticus]EHC7286923.1 hypothetical protein [Vibrio parahaemolyticus]EHZ2724433.1 hypothetical protein [Vibrio parahaemolyticus]EIA1625471.1 hypothetical protein [Vibrio parahaemolyticus]EIV1597153.1 hypothetical protein [Vibrio parahaemolyticus]